MATGEVEVIPTSVEVLNESLTPPFYINEPVEVDELLRLKYRYLDLRRPEVVKAIYLRHQVVKFIRDFLGERDFIEVETPTLIKATPRAPATSSCPVASGPANSSRCPSPHRS